MPATTPVVPVCNNAESNFSAYSGGDTCETADRPITTETSNVQSIINSNVTTYEFEGMTQLIVSSVSPTNVIYVDNLCPLPSPISARFKSAPNMILNVAQLASSEKYKKEIELEFLKKSLKSTPSINVPRNYDAKDSDRSVKKKHFCHRLLSFCKPFTTCCCSGEKHGDDINVTNHRGLSSFFSVN